MLRQGKPNSPSVLSSSRRKLDHLIVDLNEPWEQYDENWDSWEQNIREIRNLSAGILWLLIARGLIARCFRTRR
jgi:hypothetical protein